MLRICMVLNRYFPAVGGTETQAAQLMRQLVGRGYAVQIVTRRLTSDLPPHDTIDGIAVRRLSPVGLSHGANALMVGRMFWYLLQHRSDFDLIHVHVIGPVGMAAILAGKLIGKPVVLLVPTAGDLQRTEHHSVQISRYSRIIRRFVLPSWLWSRILRQASAFIAISREIAEEGKVLQSEDKVAHIPNGVDIERFAPAKSEDEKQGLRQKLNLPAEGPLLLFTGRLVSRKRVDLLLKALPELLDDYPDCHLLLAGSGAMQADGVEDDLRQMAETLGIAAHVHFLGMVDNVQDYLRAADVYVFPSEREGMPNAVMEAMATGLPIVASEIGGITDMLDSQAAWLFPAGEGDALLNAIREALANPAEAARRGATARQIAESRYSFAAVTDAYVALYKQVTE